MADSNSAEGDRRQAGACQAEPVSLDCWLPKPAVRSYHHRSAATDPDTLWQAATKVRLRDTSKLGRLVRWRIPDLSPSLTYHDMFRAYPFAVLDEGERYLIAGLCGRIWTLTRDYPRLDGAEGFARWDEPGTVRVLFGHWVTATDKGAELCIEARVQPVDGAAALRLRALWAVVGPFERLVGAEAIAAATAR